MADQESEVGFVGLGHMGAPMVERLLGAGLRVTVTDVRAEAIESAVQAGAVAAGSPREVADRASVILVSLPTPAAAELVALGPDGIVRGSALRIYVDLSTTGPAVAEKVAAGLASHGIMAVDAPVSGGVTGARAGTLTMMLAGAKEALADVDPLLAHFGTRRFVVGDRPGQAQVMKLINNMLSATAFAATAEAMVLGRQAGLGAERMLDVINVSTGRSNASEDKFPKFVLPRTFDFGFGLGLQAKDLGLYVAEAQRRRLPAFMGTATANLLGLAVAEGMGGGDSTALVQLLEQWAEVTVEGSGAQDPV